MYNFMQTKMDLVYKQITGRSNGWIFFFEKNKKEFYYPQKAKIWFELILMV
jgi:hypothetical protein